MTYLNPPPPPAPVVVTKDFGGLVADYQARTAEYRAENREVRVHECHSACTMVLSLPNACVYPDSIFKFHQAYNLRNRLTDFGVSAELFNSYPDAVRARLGTLTRDFKILRGSELIQLGIRDCDEPRIMVASAGKTVQRPLDQDSLSSVVHGWMGTLTSPLGQAGQQVPSSQTTRVASREVPKSTPSELLFADSPLPPARPPELETGLEDSWQAALAAGKPSDVPLPPSRPVSLSLAYTQRLPVAARLKLIGGAVPILSSKTFVAFAAIQR